MLERELLQTSLTTSFVPCTQLFPLNSRPMTGPRKEKRDKFTHILLLKFERICKELQYRSKGLQHLHARKMRVVCV